MRRASVLLLLGAGACNAVFGLAPVGEGAIDGALIDGGADADAPIDAAPCVEDEFDGAELDAHWMLLAGMPPTTSLVSGSRFVITNAPFAPTPSLPLTSWIYDLERDKGNQLAWAQPIGDGDFTVDADLAWSSSNSELTLGGIGVSDANGGIAAWIGVQDGSPTIVGHAAAHSRGADGVDRAYVNNPTEPGAIQVGIARAAGLATITLDGDVVLTEPMPLSIANVVIIYVRNHQDTTNYEFGSFEVGRLRVCR